VRSQRESKPMAHVWVASDGETSRKTFTGVFSRSSTLLKGTKARESNYHKAGDEQTAELMYDSSDSIDEVPPLKLRGNDLAQ
jgi:hypothetical protein